MLPDIGMFELLLIAAIAIIVVGPKDLPKMLRAVGQWMAKARKMAGEFQRSFDEMAKETELAELRKEVNALKANNPISDIKKEIEKTVEPVKEIGTQQSLESTFGGYNPTSGEKAEENTAEESVPADTDDPDLVAKPNIVESDAPKPQHKRPGVDEL